MKIEDIIPNVELCKLIPDGEFSDCVFVWVHDSFNLYPAARELVAKDYSGHIYPAPTLQEILRETQPGDTAVFCCHHGGGSWSMGDSEQDLYVINGFEGEIPPEIALRWWFSQKGIG